MLLIFKWYLQQIYIFSFLGAIFPMNHKHHFCYKCGKSYRQRYNMLRHLQLECSQEPKFKCHLCGYRAKRRNVLQTHMVTKHKLN